MSFMEKVRPLFNASHSQWPSGLRCYVTSDGVETRLGFVVQIYDRNAVGGQSKRMI